MKIISSAPVRLDFNGGGTDVNPFASLYGGAVLNATVNRGYTVTLTPQEGDSVDIVDRHERRQFIVGKKLTYGNDPDFDLVRAALNFFLKEIKHGCKIEISSNIEDSSGLGTSASFCVTLLGALFKFINKPANKARIARLAFTLETKELKWPGGKQDQWCAAYGGLNLMKFGPGERVVVTSLNVSPVIKNRLNRWLLVCYTGGKRKSKDLQTNLQKNMRRQRSKNTFIRMKQLAFQSTQALRRDDFKKFGQLVHIGWEEKKRSNPIITNHRIDSLYKVARENGAVGGQLAGAGQVGFLFFIAPPQNHPMIKSALRALGGQIVNYKLTNKGLTVTTNNTN